MLFIFPRFRFGIVSLTFVNMAVFIKLFKYFTTFCFVLKS